jgi:RHS repeat-associated protein
MDLLDSRGRRRGAAETGTGRHDHGQHLRRPALLGHRKLDGGVATVDYFGTDHLGSTRVVLDATGNAVSMPETEFTPFGKLIESPDTPRPTDHLFTGHERDFDLGLDYMHARYYSAELGRFLSVDPVGGRVESSQSWNLYSYVVKNPVGAADPTGMLEPGDTLVFAHVNDDGSTGKVGHTQTVLSDSTLDNDFDFESTVVVEYGSKTPHATEVTLRSEDDPRKEMAIVGKVPSKDDDMTEQDVRQKLEEWRNDKGDPSYGNTEEGTNECYNLSTHLTRRSRWNFDVWELFRRSVGGANKNTPRGGLKWWERKMVPIEGDQSGGQ